MLVSGGGSFVAAHAVEGAAGEPGGGEALTALLCVFLGVDAVDGVPEDLYGTGDSRIVGEMVEDEVADGALKGAQGLVLGGVAAAAAVPVLGGGCGRDKRISGHVFPFGVA